MLPIFSLFLKTEFYLFSRLFLLLPLFLSSPSPSSVESESVRGYLASFTITHILVVFTISHIVLLPLQLQICAKAECNITLFEFRVLVASQSNAITAAQLRYAILSYDIHYVKYYGSIY